MFYPLVIMTALKIMLYPVYFSTDFDVHKNWMRITYNENIKDWYFDDFSEWTLDYPPLFAYFEYLLSLIAFQIDPRIVDKEYLHVHSKTVILYQRLTVMLSDMVYMVMVMHVMEQLNIKRSKVQQFVLLFPFGLLLIDDIHFQYNGLLKGLLLLSCLYLQKEQLIKASLTFSILLCFKHIYIYVAPVFFIILLKQSFVKRINFFKISSTVCGVFLVSFYPFLSIRQLSQIGARLFPIGRGLVHSFWAPNFWALYCFIDRILGNILKILNSNHKRSSDLVAGKVQITSFEVLPQINTFYTLLLVVAFSIPLWVIMWKSKTLNSQKVFYYAALQSLIFYNFGYHVHEKAIMIPLILSCLINGESIWLASIINSIALLPLIPSTIEQPFLIIALILYHIIYYADQKNRLNLSINVYEKLYILLGVLIAIFHLVIHPLFLRDKFQFLPLMLYSVYASLFNQYWLYITYEKIQEQITKK